MDIGVQLISEIRATISGVNAASGIYTSVGAVPQVFTPLTVNNVNQINPALGLILPAPQTEKELKHLSFVAYALNSYCVLQYKNYFSSSVSAAAENYNLRARKHNRMLAQHTTRLFDSNFIYRALYSDIY